jgi:predicted dehydrogenase
VEEEDNAHVLMDHGNGIISHVMCGFNYFDPHGHEAKGQQLHSIQIFGDKGNMRLIGYDWETNGVILDDSWERPGQLHEKETGGYMWQEGATIVAESMVHKTEPLINVEHALHVLEIIEAARKSSASGMRVPLISTFKWPVV